MDLQPSQQRRLEQRENARRAILVATEQLLVESGYERFSMRRLSERCGYSSPTVYHYFGDKLRLIDALLEERFAVVLARLRRVAQGSDPVQNIRALASAFVRFALQNPTHYRLLSAPRDTELPMPPAAEESRALVLRPLEQLFEAGRLATRDVETAYQVVWAALHGAISLRINRPEYTWESDLDEQLMAVLCRGLVTAPEGSA
jgi:AcrR family transcriptional regulator